MRKIMLGAVALAMTAAGAVASVGPAAAQVVVVRPPVVVHRPVVVVRRPAPVVVVRRPAHRRWVQVCTFRGPVRTCHGAWRYY